MYRFMSEVLPGACRPALVPPGYEVSTICLGIGQFLHDSTFSGKRLSPFRTSVLLHARRNACKGMGFNTLSNAPLSRRRE